MEFWTLSCKVGDHGRDQAYEGYVKKKTLQWAWGHGDRWWISISWWIRSQTPSPPSCGAWVCQSHPGDAWNGGDAAMLQGATRKSWVSVLTKRSEWNRQAAFESTESMMFARLRPFLHYPALPCQVKKLQKSGQLDPNVDDPCGARLLLQPLLPFGPRLGTWNNTTELWLSAWLSHKIDINWFFRVACKLSIEVVFSNELVFVELFPFPLFEMVHASTPNVNLPSHQIFERMRFDLFISSTNIRYWQPGVFDLSGRIAQASLKKNQASLDQDCKFMAGKSTCSDVSKPDQFLQFVRKCVGIYIYVYTYIMATTNKYMVARARNSPQR